LGGAINAAGANRRTSIHGRDERIRLGNGTVSKAVDH
jgi:hypothetical protein